MKNTNDDNNYFNNNQIPNINNDLDNNLFEDLGIEQNNNKNEQLFLDVLGEVEKKNKKKKKKKIKKGKTPNKFIIPPDQQYDEFKIDNEEKEENFSPKKELDTPLGSNYNKSNIDEVENILDSNTLQNNKEYSDNNKYNEIQIKNNFSGNKKKALKKPPNNFNGQKYKGYAEGFMNKMKKEKNELECTLGILEKAKQLKEQDDKYKKPEKEESFWSILFAPFKCGS